jgi:chaperonin GroEL
MYKIIENAGGDRNISCSCGKGIGVNVVSMAMADMMDIGIIDPTKVTKEAVRNAVSVATTLLSTDTVITNIRA